MGEVWAPLCSLAKRELLHGRGSWSTLQLAHDLSKSEGAAQNDKCHLLCSTFKGKADVGEGRALAMAEE